jgi:diguanylate cyclase (GGDEF)-like protein
LASVTVDQQPGPVLAGADRRGLVLLRGLGFALAVAVGYCAFGLLGRLASIPDAGVSVFWPPTALGIAVIARTRGRWRVAGVAGLVLGELTVDTLFFRFPVWLAAAFVVVNLCEQFAIGTLLSRWGAASLSTARDLAVLLVGAAVVTAITGSVGGWCAVTQFGGDYLPAWRTWFFGAFSAAIILAPFLLTVRVPRHVQPRRVFSLALPILVMIAAVSWPADSPFVAVVLLSVVIAPLLAWIALRRGLTAVAGAASLIIFVAAALPARGGVVVPVSGEAAVALAAQLIRLTFCLAIYAAAITEQARRRSDEAQRAAHQQLSLLFASSPAPIARIDRHDGDPGVIATGNDAFAGLVGCRTADLPGRALSEFIQPPEALASGVDGIIPSAFRLTRADGTKVWVAATWEFVPHSGPDSAGFYILFAEDVTDRLEYTGRLAEQATHDALTGLRNRYAFIDEVNTMLRPRTEGSAELTVLLCDLDDFQSVNDSLGHAAGDELLCLVADRLSKACDDATLIARVGGDEFALARWQSDEARESEVFESAVRASLTSRVVINGSEHRLGVSIGKVVADGSRLTASELLLRADLALYEAKSSARGSTVDYQPEMQVRLQHKIDMNAGVRQALDEDRVVCWYQPIVDPSGGSTVGAEALVRIRQPDGSLLFPDSFIEFAEAGGSVVELGDRVLELALAWRAGRGLAAGQLRVSVNVSVKQLADAAFPERVRQMLARFGVDPRDLVVEVTEHVILDEGGQAPSALEALRDLGVEVAIDDFGTGYSSLNALRWMPFDIVKIDRAFTASMVVDANDFAIVSAVIMISHAMGRKVVAEGVETQAQAQALAELGCDLMQGYYFSRPQPPESFTLVEFPALAAAGLRLPAAHDPAP